MGIHKKLIFLKHYYKAPQDSWRTLGHCDVILMCHDSDRSASLNGKVYSPLIDSVGDDLSNRGWVVARLALPTSLILGNKAHGNPVSIERSLLKAQVLHYLMRLSNNLFHKKEFLDSDYNQFDVAFYLKLLKRTNARCVISIGTPLGMCKAGHLQKIPIVELLHGIGYYPIPWGWDKINIENLPNLILSLDNVSTNTFTPLQDKGATIRQIPHPWLKRFINVEERQKLPSEWKGNISVSSKFRKVILVSLNKAYDDENHPEYAGIIPNGIMIDELRKVIESTNDSIFWLLRLHGVQLRNRKYVKHLEYIRDLVNKTKNSEWKLASSIPLPSLLPMCDGHITMCSMVSYEAAYFGVPTLLLCPTLRLGGLNEGMFSDLKESGHAKLGSFDEAFIHSWVEKVSRMKEVVPSLSEAAWDEAIEFMLGKRQNTNDLIDK